MTVSPPPSHFAYVLGKRRAVAAAQFCLGVLSVVVLGAVVWRLIPVREAPPGWLLVRPPGDTLAVARVEHEVWAGGPEGLFVLPSDVSGEGQRIASAPPFRQVASIHAMPGEVWIAHAQGVSRREGEEWVTYGQRDGLPDVQAWVVLKGRDGSVWVGTERGLAQRKHGSWRVWTTRDGLAADAVTVLHEDRRGRLWVGNGLTFAGGLSLIEGERARDLGIADLPHVMINAIAEDETGGIWVGTGFGSRGGACRFSDDGTVRLGKKDGLAGEKVRSIFVGRGGAVWFGSEYDGAARLVASEWMTLARSDGLAGNEVKAIVEDASGNLWFASEQGVARCPRAVCAGSASHETRD